MPAPEATPALPMNTTKTTTTWTAFGIFAVANVVLTLLIMSSDNVAPWFESWMEPVATFCHKAPFFVGSGMLVVLWLFYRLLSGNASPLELIRGTDKRFSVSKCQFLLWTLLVFFSYTSIVAAAIGKHLMSLLTILPPGAAADGHSATASVGLAGMMSMPQNLLLAMGLSVTTALAAKGITVSQIDNGAASRDHIDADQAALGDMLKDNGGDIDLSKVQLIGWTMIGLATYFASVVRMVHQIGLGKMSEKLITLPDIDSSLMVLMGLGQGTYLVKKMIKSSTPAVATAKGSCPAGGRLGGEVTLTGSGFGGSKGDSVLTFKGSNADFPIKNWSDTSITFILPDDKPDIVPGPARIGVIVSNQPSNTVPLTVLRAPKISGASLAGSTLTITGSGFGTPQPKTGSTAADSITINGKPVAAVSSWNDTKIELANPDAATVKAGSDVKIVLTVDGETLPETVRPI